MTPYPLPVPVVGVAETFFDVATADPVSALLVTIGGLITAVSMIVLGYLSLGGAVAGLLRVTES